MKPKTLSTMLPLPKIFGVAFAFVLLLSASVRAADETNTDLKLEAQLIWGSNDSPARDATNNLVGPKIEKKLKRLPFKWEHYFEVHRENFKAILNEEKTLTMSRNCVIKVMNIGNDQIKFQLVGKGKLVNTVSQSLPKGQLLITGGDAENSTAWFVVLRQVD